MIYWIVRIVCWPLVQILFLFSTIRNAQKIPKEGAAILICNHYSLFDPVLLTTLVGRHIYFMAKAELFKTKFSNWFFRKMGAFPVYRKAADVNALKSAFTILKRGDILGIFPEGTRTKKGIIGKFESGAALFAIRTKARVVPVAIVKKYGMFKRTAFVVGEELDLSEFYDRPVSAEVLSDAALTMQKAVEKLIMENQTI